MRHTEALFMTVAGGLVGCAAAAPVESAQPAAVAPPPTARPNTAEPALSAASSAPTCFHKRPAACTSPQLDFARDVVPILTKRCFSCHAGNGEVAVEHNFSRLPSVLSHRSGMARRIAACSMPPQGSDPVTPSEAETLLGWLACQDVK